MCLMCYQTFIFVVHKYDTLKLVMLPEYRCYPAFLVLLCFLCYLDTCFTLGSLPCVRLVPLFQNSKFYVSGKLGVCQVCRLLSLLYTSITQVSRVTGIPVLPCYLCNFVTCVTLLLVLPCYLCLYL